MYSENIFFAFFGEMEFKTNVQMTFFLSNDWQLFLGNNDDLWLVKPGCSKKDEKLCQTKNVRQDARFPGIPRGPESTKILRYKDKRWRQ